MNKINTLNLKKSYTDTKALNDVSFSLECGDITILLGPNGAGKTTLINIMLGLIKADQGEIYYESKPLNIPYSLEQRRKFFYLPDEPIVLDYLTGYENIEYINSIYKSDLLPCDLEEILDEFNILKYKDKLVKDYSKGMKQRLCLSFLRVYTPEVIVLDEPTVGLDIIGTQELIKLLKKLKNEQKTILISTHDINFCKQVADEIVVLNKGRIIAKNPSQKIINQYDTIENAIMYFLEVSNEQTHYRGD